MICPFCKEEILDGSLKCRHCDSVIPSTSNIYKKKEAQGQKQAEAGRTSLIIGIAMLFFAILWIITLEDAVKRSLANDIGYYLIAKFNNTAILIWVGCAIFCVFGIVLGLKGLGQANRKHHLSAIGLTLNIAIIPLASYFIISPDAVKVLYALIIFGSAFWVYNDANLRGVKKDWNKRSFTNMGPGGWGFCMVLFWILMFPLYLIKREEYQPQIQPKKEQQVQSAQSPEKPAPSTPNGKAQDLDQELRTLARLKEDGIITQEEFDLKKKALLGI